MLLIMASKGGSPVPSHIPLPLCPHSLVFLCDCLLPQERAMQDHEGTPYNSLELPVGSLEDAVEPNAQPEEWFTSVLDLVVAETDARFEIIQIETGQFEYLCEREQHCRQHEGNASHKWKIEAQQRRASVDEAYERQQRDLGEIDALERHLQKLQARLMQGYALSSPQ